MSTSRLSQHVDSQAAGNDETASFGLPDQALTQEGLVRYFAYGSCMNHASLTASLGFDVTTGFLGAAVLEQYRLAFDYPAMSEPVCYANLVADPRSQAEGALFALPVSTLAALDKREGVTQGRYQRQFLKVRVEGNDPVQALTYVGSLMLPSEAAPSARYADLLTQGLRDSGVSAGYLDWLVQHMAALPVRVSV